MKVVFGSFTIECQWNLDKSIWLGYDLFVTILSFKTIELENKGLCMLIRKLLLVIQKYLKDKGLILPITEK